MQQSPTNVHSFIHLCNTVRFSIHSYGTTIGIPTHIEGMDKIMGTDVKDKHFLIDTELDHQLPVMQVVSYLE